MKSIRFWWCSIILLLMSGVFNAFDASGRVKVRYHQNESAEISGLLGVLHGSQLTAVVHADSSEFRLYRLDMICVIDGAASRHTLGYAPISKDSTSICITTMMMDSTSVAVFLNPGSATRQVAHGRFSGHELLIDLTKTDGYADGNEIVLATYSSGIPKKMEFQGQTCDVLDICGLRYSEVDPREWPERFGLKHYVYFVAVPCKEFRL